MRRVIEIKRALYLPAAAVALAGGFWAAVGVAGGNASAKSGHVTICHRTGSHHNPYVVISPSVAGVYHGHYRRHNEGVVFPNTAADGKWGDIIPTFRYRGVSYSLNWNAQGQAIWNNGCRPATSGTTGTTGSTSTTGSTNTTESTTVVTSTGTTTTVTTPGSTVTVTTPETTTSFTPPPPPHKKHHKKRPHHQTFTPPKVKLPHTT